MMRQDDGAAVGEAELVAAEGRDAAGIGDGGVVEIIARVEGGVAQELEDRAVKAAAAGAGNDVGEAGCAAADLGGHPAGDGLDLLDGVDVEVGEGRAAHLGIAGVGAVHGEGGLDAALAVDGELLGEVGGAVGVGHGAGGEQQELAEVALVQRDGADGLAGELLASGGFHDGCAGQALKCNSDGALLIDGDDRWEGIRLEFERCGSVMANSGDYDGDLIASRRRIIELKASVCLRLRHHPALAADEVNLGAFDRSAAGIVQYPLPRAC